MLKPRFLLPLLCAFLMLGLTACNQLTQERFNRIEEGMSYEEVIAILGEPTDSDSVGVGPLSASTATWENDQAKINIKFLNQKVQLKTYRAKEKP